MIDMLICILLIILIGIVYQLGQLIYRQSYIISSICIYFEIILEYIKDRLMKFFLFLKNFLLKKKYIHSSQRQALFILHHELENNLSH